MCTRKLYLNASLSRHLQISSLFICFIFVISQNAFAQSDRTDNDSAVSNIIQALHDEDDDRRPPVEAGAGGAIELEKFHRTEAESLYDWHTHLLWESRYVLEGRDILSGEGLYSLSSEFTIDDVTFVPWLAHSPGADYSELNLNFVYSTYLTQDLAASLGYTHLRFHYPDEHTRDNEISLDLGYQVLKQVTLSANIYHSFEADGSFIEMAVIYNDVLSNKIHYSLQGTLGSNAGYVADGHNGLNHAQLLGNVSYQPVRQIEFYAYAGYNKAINEDKIQYAGDESLSDFFWGGIGAVFLF